MQETVSFTLHKFTDATLLAAEYQLLLNKAQEATSLSYAPYSKFKVGAAALLSNGEIIQGSNQENASFGATICAERTVLGLISTLAPKEHILTLAIRYINENGHDNAPISPCGICRQSLLEYQNQHNCKIKIIMTGRTGNIWLINDASELLPLAFSVNSLK